jgi:hypothetical protein
MEPKRETLPTGEDALNSRELAKNSSGIHHRVSACGTWAQTVRDIRLARKGGDGFAGEARDLASVSPTGQDQLDLN